MSDASEPERVLAERRIREVNEAWSTLQSPKARQAYDQTLFTRPRAGRPPVATNDASRLPAEADDDLVDVMPPMTALTAGLFRHLPWVVIAVVFTLIFVLTAYAGRGANSANESNGATAIAVGSCIVVVQGPSAEQVACDGNHQYRIAAQVAVAADCPPGTEARRLQEGPQIECLEVP